MLTILPRNLIIRLKLKYLPCKLLSVNLPGRFPVGLQVEHHYLIQLAFFFFLLSLVGCFPLSFWGGGEEGWEDSNEEWTGTPPVLGVESIVGGSVGGAIEVALGATWDRTPLNDPAPFLMESRMLAKWPMFTAETRKNMVSIRSQRNWWKEKFELKFTCGRPRSSVKCGVWTVGVSWQARSVVVKLILAKVWCGN